MNKFNLDNLNEREALAKHVASVTFRDDNVGKYSKTREEAEEKWGVASDTSAPPTPGVKKILGSPSMMETLLANSALAFLDKGIYFCIISRDGYHGYTHHISVSQMDPANSGARIMACDKALSELAEVMFSEWKEIPNPGAMKEVRHLVGNAKSS